MLPLNNISRLKLLAIVARIGFFKELNVSQRESLLNMAKCYKCHKDKFVQTEDDLNRNFYIVLSGEIAILKKGSENIIGRIGVGEFIGESSFINKHRKSASAKAMIDSIVLCIDQDAMRDMPVKVREKCKDAIIEGMAKRIVYLSDHIQELL